MATICDFTNDDGTVPDEQIPLAERANNTGELPFDAVIRLIDANNTGSQIESCVGSGPPASEPGCFNLLQEYWPAAVAAANDQGIIDNVSRAESAYSESARQFTSEIETAVEQMVSNGCVLGDAIETIQFDPYSVERGIRGNILFAVPDGELLPGTGFDVSVRLALDDGRGATFRFGSVGAEFEQFLWDVELSQGEFKVCVDQIIVST